jgi:putative endonuclease
LRGKLEKKSNKKMRINKKQACIYIISNSFGNVIYIGVTSYLWFRILEHKQGNGSVFTKKYKLHKLIYFEEFEDINDAIYRETQIKKWNRKWKEELIDTLNKERIDLAKKWYSETDVSEYLNSKKFFTLE